MFAIFKNKQLTKYSFPECFVRSTRFYPCILLSKNKENFEAKILKCPGGKKSVSLHFTTKNTPPCSISIHLFRIFVFLLNSVFTEKSNLT